MRVDGGGPNQPIEAKGLKNSTVKNKRPRDEDGQGFRFVRRQSISPSIGKKKKKGTLVEIDRGKKGSRAGLRLLEGKRVKSHRCEKGKGRSKKRGASWRSQQTNLRGSFTEGRKKRVKKGGGGAQL